jgi:hypothetical protein
VGPALLGRSAGIALAFEAIEKCLEEVERVNARLE